MKASWFDFIEIVLDLVVWKLLAVSWWLKKFYTEHWTDLKPAQFKAKYCPRNLKNVSLTSKRRPVLSEHFLSLWSQTGTSSYSALCSAFIMGLSWAQQSLTVPPLCPFFMQIVFQLHLSRWGLHHMHYCCCHWTSHTHTRLTKQNVHHKADNSSTYALRRDG